MSDSQTLTTVVVAALGGAGLGAALAAVVCARRGFRLERRVRRIDAYAQWLAARKRLTRATVTFVTSFRELRTCDRTNGAVAAGRRADARRARREWRDAAHALDTAEAGLTAWTDDASLAWLLSEHGPPSSAAVRTAIDADGTRAQVFCDALVQQDRLAAEVFRPGRSRRNGRSVGLYAVAGLFRSAVFALDDLASRWSRP